MMSGYFTGGPFKLEKPLRVFLNILFILSSVVLLFVVTETAERYMAIGMLCLGIVALVSNLKAKT